MDLQNFGANFAFTSKVPKRFVYIALLIIARTVAGQGNSDFKVLRQTWDFGTVNFWKNDTAHFLVQNLSNKKLVFLPTGYHEKYKVIFSTKQAYLGETIDIAIIYYAQEKGKFNEKIPLYFNLSATPIEFKLKGEIKGFDPSALIRCPTVNDEPEPVQEKVVTIEVKDMETDVQLNPDLIIVRNRKNDKIKLEKAGMDFEAAMSPGQFSIVCNKKLYEDYSAIITLEPYQTKIIVYLEKKNNEETAVKNIDTPTTVAIIDRPKVIEKPVIKIDTISITKNDRPDVKPPVIVTETDTSESGEWLEIPTNPVVIKKDSLIIPPKKIDSFPVTIAKKDTIKKETEITKSGELNNKLFKPNNVILIVDVSASMKQNQKIDQLKMAIADLVNAYRGTDILGIIALSTNAEVFIPVGHIENKDSVINKLQRMKATGATNGGAALRLAYSLAQQNFIEGGNNQIIIATDGLFSTGFTSRKAFDAMLKENAVKGIKLSTVGFGNDPKAMNFLQTIANTGDGTFIQIENGDTHLLLEMIKNQSRK